jgi:hypothetical protein
VTGFVQKRVYGRIAAHQEPVANQTRLGFAPEAAGDRRPIGDPLALQSVNAEQPGDGEAIELLDAEHISYLWRRRHRHANESSASPLHRSLTTIPHPSPGTRTD